MDSEPNPPVAPGNHPMRKLIWLFVALVPGAVGLLCLMADANLDRSLVPLTILDVALTLLAAVGFSVDLKEPVDRFLLGFFLWGFFFVVNAIVVVAVGCSLQPRL